MLKPADFAPMDKWIRNTLRELWGYSPTEEEVSVSEPTTRMTGFIKVRKRPVVVEAIQFTEANMEEISRLPGVHVTNSWGVSVLTMEGFKPLPFGYWIIRGIKGELYPCEPEIYDLTYEPE